MILLLLHIHPLIRLRLFGMCKEALKQKQRKYAGLSTAADRAHTLVKSTISPSRLTKDKLSYPNETTQTAARQRRQPRDTEKKGSIKKVQPQGGGCGTQRRRTQSTSERSFAPDNEGDGPFSSTRKNKKGPLSRAFFKHKTLVLKTSEFDQLELLQLLLE